MTDTNDKIHNTYLNNNPSLGSSYSFFEIFNLKHKRFIQNPYKYNFFSKHTLSATPSYCP